MNRIQRGTVRNRDRRKKPDPKTNRSWQLIFDRPPLTGERRRQQFVSFTGTEAEAHRRLQELLVDARRGALPDDRGISVADFFAWWFKHRRIATNVTKRHIEDQESLVELHVLPAVGTKRLTDLSARNLRELYDDLLRSGRIARRHGADPGLSQNTVNHIHRVVFAALRMARQMDFVVRNVADDVKAPSPAVTGEYRVLSLGEAAQLVNAALATRLFLVIFIAVVTGLRRCEILGLRWRNINVAAEELTVECSIQRDGSVSTPKSRRSRRTISVSTELLSFLEAARSAAHTDNSFIFQHAGGVTWIPDSIGTLYRRIVRDAKIEYVKFRELRHSAASIMIAAGVPIPTVSRILGHANSEITMRVYAQAIRELDERARTVMSDNAKHIAAFTRAT